MKVALCTIGERTTNLCKWALEREGFEVVMFDKQQTWYEKYCEFITWAYKENLESVVRIDADIIPNKNLKNCIAEAGMSEDLLVQFQTFDFYKNDLGNSSPIYYRRKAIARIYNELKNLDKKRPETSASRLVNVNPHFGTIERVCGMHGFFQTPQTMTTAKKHKTERGQLPFYDFDLVDKIIEL